MEAMGGKSLSFQGCVICWGEMAAIFQESGREEGHGPSLAEEFSLCRHEDVWNTGRARDFQEKYKRGSSPVVRETLPDDGQCPLSVVANLAATSPTRNTTSVTRELDFSFEVYIAACGKELWHWTVQSGRLLCSF